MNYLPPIKLIHDSLSLREVNNTSSASGGGGGATALCLLLGLAPAPPPWSSTSGSLSPAPALARVLLLDIISADIIKTYFVLNNTMG